MDEIDYSGWQELLRAASEQVSAQHELLTKLDSVGGDGDHGTTMKRAMAALRQACDDCAGPPPSALFNDAAWAIMGIDGGATGPLLGSLFLGMSEAAGDAATCDAMTLATVFEAGLGAVRRQTAAQPGDKTMLDALVPAVAAMGKAALAGASPTACLEQAADAAERGAAATTDMEARHGRARSLGARSIGSADPGATSTSLMFRAFASAAATLESEEE